MTDHQDAIEVTFTDLVVVSDSEPAQVIETTVTISEMEYQLLTQIVIDMGSMVKLMMQIQQIFTDFTEGQDLTLASIGRMILSKPGKFKTAAQQLAEPVVGMAPFIKKYGAHAHSMSQQHESNEHPTQVSVSRSESES